MSRLEAIADRPPPSHATTDPLPVVRQAVRSLLLSSPAYAELDPASRRKMAELMVKVCNTAVALLLEEAESDRQVQQLATADSSPTPQLLATAQAAGQDFSGVAAARVAGTTRAILNAVSFPRFVTELINGVFKAIVETSIQQMTSFVELLNNVAASTEGFAAANLGPERARAWLAERYPASFELVGVAEEIASEEEAEQGGLTLRLRSGASMPPAEALRVDLGLAENETIPTGDPDRTLVPLARRQLAKMRQEILATMVMLGMQRIIIEGGKINAAMRFHIDTRSAAQAEAASRFNFENQLKASAKFGLGAWGFSADMTNTIGYVSTQRSQTTEEMNTDLELNSSVELIFRTDQVPLNRLASASQTTKILANTRNPEAEVASRERIARTEVAARNDEARRTSLDRSLSPRSAPPTITPTPSASTSLGASGKQAT